MSQKKAHKFRTVSIKADLVTSIEDYVKHSKLYRSIAEFVSECVRIRLGELQSKSKEASS